MGSGASSLPSTIDKPTAKSAAGTHFDEKAFDEAAVNGVVSRDAFLSAASSLADTPAVAHTLESLMQCRSFLLGSHSRVGADSPVQKLPPDLLKRICAHVLQPMRGADWHFHGSSATLGSVDLWLFVGDTEPPTTKKGKRNQKKKAQDNERLRAILQQQQPGASTATRYLGWQGDIRGKCPWDSDENSPPFCFDWTHEASELEPHRPPAATKQEIGASKIKDNAPDSAFQLREAAVAKPPAAASSTTKRSSRGAPLYTAPVDIRYVGLFPDGVRLVRQKYPELSLIRDFVLAPAADNRRSVAHLMKEYSFVMEEEE